MNKVYMCIDLKSFYASVECVERKLDPITTNLVVADITHTEKTICLAVTPALKQYGLSGRSRLFEVIKKVKDINYLRKKNNNGFLKGKSYNDIELKNNSNLELDYIVASPRMNLYKKYSTSIYSIYLKYLSAQDIFVYSIDEVFCDITNYLKLYKMSPKELVTKIIHDVYETTGITATAGIGNNLYLCKVAMDIVAKHMDPDEKGVRIAELNEISYRKELWNHKPIADFWRIGNGISKRLEKFNIYTMGDLARFSLENENLLFKSFGVNAELLIDHAWGYEPCTMESIKNYKPSTTSLSSGQVLHEPYNYEKTKLIVREMTELLILDMYDKNYVTDQIVLTIGYDKDNLLNDSIMKNYDGEIVKDFYGRSIPKSAHGTIRLKYKSSSITIISKAVMQLFESIINRRLLTRRINISVCNLESGNSIKNNKIYEQCNLFSKDNNNDNISNMLEIENNDIKIQKVIMNIKRKYGKNAILKGMNLEEGATTIERNLQVGGHKG